MVTAKRLRNILKYGFGDEARAKKQADKEKARNARFASDLWQGEGEIARRRYDSYDAYLEHQAAKLDEISDRLDETRAEDLAEFERRFRLCQSLLGCRNVLCLGARLGTEVEALIRLGHFALGVDLNPGEHNRLVVTGDFHDLVFATGSVDAVYTNTLDHVFDLDRLMGEITRILRPGGLFIADTLQGFSEGFTPGRYESMHWRSRDELVAAITAASGMVVVEEHDLGHHRRDHWQQITFAKPAAGPAG